MLEIVKMLLILIVMVVLMAFVHPMEYFREHVLESKSPTERLRFAVLDGDVQGVRRALRDGVSLNDSDQDGGDLLAYAAGLGRARIVGVLVDAGADVNRIGLAGESAIYWAACRGQTDIVRYLLDHGADANRGESAVLGGARGGSVPIVSLLLRRGIITDRRKLDQALLDAAYHTDQPVLLQLLLSAGAHLDAENGDGRTALQVSILEGHLANALYLIKARVGLAPGSPPHDQLVGPTTSQPEVQKS